MVANGVLSSTGLRYVQRLFPRMYLAAALESATVAARRDHDANIGRRSFHLFRLSAHMERQLADLIRTEGALGNLSSRIHLHNSLRCWKSLRFLKRRQ